MLHLLCLIRVCVCGTTMLQLTTQYAGLLHAHLTDPLEGNMSHDKDLCECGAQHHVRMRG